MPVCSRKASIYRDTFGEGMKSYDEAAGELKPNSRLGSASSGINGVIHFTANSSQEETLPQGPQYWLFVDLTPTCTCLRVECGVGASLIVDVVLLIVFI